MDRIHPDLVAAQLQVAQAGETVWVTNPRGLRIVIKTAEQELSWPSTTSTQTLGWSSHTPVLTGLTRFTGLRNYPLSHLAQLGDNLPNCFAASR